MIRFVEKFKFFVIYLKGKGNWLKVWNFYGYLYFLLWRCYASEMLRIRDATHLYLNIKINTGMVIKLMLM
jgi:hypothetical protein